MECEKVYPLLVERLYEHIQGGVRAELSTHLELCEACRIEAASLDELFTTMDRWQTPDPPAGLAALAVERSVRGGHPLAHGEPRSGHAFTHLGLELLTAALSMILVVGSLPRLSIPALSLSLIGAVWAVLYVAAFAQTLHRELRIRAIAQTALCGAGLTILAAPVLSLPSVVEACSRLFAGARGSVALNLLLFLIGALYTGIPISISAALCDRPLARRGVVQGGSHAGLLFTMLIAPAVYIQCAALALGLVTTWMAGSLIAAVAGPTAGIPVATRLAVRQA